MTYRMGSFGRLGPAGVRDAVTRWLRLVAADADLSPYLVGVDRTRLAGHLALTLTTALGGPAGGIARPAAGAWRGLGLTEAQHRRVVDYLTGVLLARDLPAAAVEAAGRAFADEAGPPATGQAASWAATFRYADVAARHFRAATGGGPQGRDGPLLFASLARLVDGGDDPAGRAALLTVLGRARRRYGLRPEHAESIADALLAVSPRKERRTPELTADWLFRCREALRELPPGGTGPAWWSARVVNHDRAGDNVAILTVQPGERLPHRPGQAVPVCTPRRPGVWRWYCPANAPRPDGTLELHVRAVAAGAVSRSLVHEVRPGEPLWLGPPAEVGLTPHPRPRRDLLLVAGGTGLAPLRAIVEQVAAAPDGRRVTLVVGARTFADLYDAIILDKLQCAHGWLTIVPAFSHDVFAEPAERGDALTVALDRHESGQEVYVCGPPAMLAGARLRLRAAGVPAARSRLPETFTR
ncbi:FAD-binding oxidoreductase [Micromonospora sp. CA-111912]|uniref:FAD-binding oxidoreductase n=1 Tax=Micromonospora sp. CA-111912 TaxID=3239955 RepID=UPI003D93C182